jgi:FG-GAP-like repeat
MDLMVVCAPSYPAGTAPTNTAILNEGNGTFKPFEDSAIQYAATPVHVADLNGDHFDDLVLSGENVDAFGVQIGNGDGTFKAPVYYQPSPSSPFGSVASIVSGDFNGDGKPDIAFLNSVYTTNSDATTDFVNTLFIFLNTGSGGMVQAASYPISTTSTGVFLPLLIAGDLIGDAESDLAVISPGASPTVTPFFATGEGTFRKGGTFSAGTTQAAKNAVIGRFTSSGYGDVAITTAAGIVVLLGNSAGNVYDGAVDKLSISAFRVRQRVIRGVSGF